MSTPDSPETMGHGSVAEEIAALAEALRVRGRGAAATAAQSFSTHDAAAPGTGQDHHRERDTGAPAASFEGGQEGGGGGQEGGPTQRTGPDHTHPPGMDACEICPVCRAIVALHTVSPAAVTALADLVHQAEITLRALATDLQNRETHDAPPQREDIPVDDLGDD